MLYNYEVKFLMQDGNRAVYLNAINWDDFKQEISKTNFISYEVLSVYSLSLQSFIYRKELNNGS